MLNRNEGMFSLSTFHTCIRRASKAVEALNLALWEELRLLGHNHVNGEASERWCLRNFEEANMWAQSCQEAFHVNENSYYCVGTSLAQNDWDFAWKSDEF